MKDFFQDHPSNQENILQSTRELHYVLQSLFLGIGFAVLAIGYAVAVSIDQEGNRWGKEFAIIIIIIFACGFIIIFGYRFLSAYSKNVYKRGVVIDVLQHLRILNYKGKLEIFLDDILEDPKEDTLFVLIKIVERMVDKGDIYRDSKRIASTLKTEKLFYPDILTFKRLDLMVYITFYGDIYKPNHPTEDPIDWENERARSITETRDGHKKSFLIVWCVLAALLVFLILFTLFKIGAAPVDILWGTFALILVLLYDLVSIEILASRFRA
jgi:hypothetical protein